MHRRAAELVRALGMQAHPEGGAYREIYRSPAAVQPQDRRPARSALTVIYFLLADGHQSRWHRVHSDEVWQHVEGAPLELVRIDPAESECETLLRGPLAGSVEPVRVIP
ncbi:MAG TPA: cupin domain-containing protein, partial [Longimicrobium sp.]|nr:cupin domain-containing protein [Longimicrobium sp.]